MEWEERNWNKRLAKGSPTLANPQGWATQGRFWDRVSATRRRGVHGACVALRRRSRVGTFSLRALFLRCGLQVEPPRGRMVFQLSELMTAGRWPARRFAEVSAEVSAWCVGLIFGGRLSHRGYLGEKSKAWPTRLRHRTSLSKVQQSSLSA